MEPSKHTKEAEKRRKKAIAKANTVARLSSMNSQRKSLRMAAEERPFKFGDKCFDEAHRQWIEEGDKMENWVEDDDGRRDQLFFKLADPDHCHLRSALRRHICLTPDNKTVIMYEKTEFPPPPSYVDRGGRKFMEGEWKEHFQTHRAVPVNSSIEFEMWLKFSLSGQLLTRFTYSPVNFENFDPNSHPPADMHKITIDDVEKKIEIHDEAEEMKVPQTKEVGALEVGSRVDVLPHKYVEENAAEFFDSRPPTPERKDDDSASKMIEE